MIDYNEDWITSLLFKKAGSIFLKAAYIAIPSTILSLLFLVMQDFYPNIREDNHLQDFQGGPLWNAFAAGLLLLIGFRGNRAIARFWEGTGLMHQMRGEWFDTVSNCVAFSIMSKGDKPTLVEEFRHTLVRLMSLCHGNALEEISGNEFELCSIDVFGINNETLRYLKISHEKYNFNKVEMCVHLIQNLITNAVEVGIIKMPPPIVSRVFQTISRGFVNLLNTKKITDTKFPFPYAQMIAFALLVFSFATPVLLTSFLQQKVFAALATFTPVFILAGLNYTAIELENPFGKDDNDLPLEEFQWEMDNCLLMLLHPLADIVPNISRHHAELDFNKLLADFRERSEELETNQRASMPKISRYDTNKLDSTASASLKGHSGTNSHRLSNLAAYRLESVRSYSVQEWGAAQSCRSQNQQSLRSDPADLRISGAALELREIVSCSDKPDEDKPDEPASGGRWSQTSKKSTELPRDRRDGDGTVEKQWDGDLSVAERVIGRENVGSAEDQLFVKMPRPSATLHLLCTPARPDRENS